MQLTLENIGIGNWERESGGNETINYGIELNSQRHKQLGKSLIQKHGVNQHIARDLNRFGKFIIGLAIIFNDKRI